MTTIDPTAAVGGTAEAEAPVAGAAEAGAAEDHEHHHGYITDKSRYLARLKRIEG